MATLTFRAVPLVVLTCAVAGAQANAIRTVSVRIDSRDSILIEPGFAGYNNALNNYAIRYDDPRLASAARALNAGWLRFPAGLRSSAFDWRSGQSPQVWVEAFKGSRFQEGFQDARDLLAAKGGERIDDAAVLGRRIGSQGLIVCVNVFTDTPASAREYAAYAATHGIHVLAWQLGNEPTFFPGFFRNAGEYAEKVRPFAEAIRAVDPSATIALSLSVAGIPDAGWDEALAAVRPRYWDAVYYHHYPQMSGPITALMPWLNAILATKTDDYVRGHVHGLFGEVPVLVTEADPGLAADPESAVGTLYGGIWAAEFALRLSTVPQVKHVGMHQLVGPAGIDLTTSHHGEVISAFKSGRPVNPDSMDFGLFLSAQGLAYSIAAGVINSASVSFATSVSGSDLLSLRPSKTFAPAIYGRAYRAGVTTSLVLTNKGERPAHVEIVYDDVVVHANFRITTVTGPAPHARNALHNTPVRSTESTTTGLITVQPYSVTRVSWTSY